MLPTKLRDSRHLFFITRTTIQQPTYNHKNTTHFRVFCFFDSPNNVSTHDNALNQNILGKIE